ncbi:hypothetical protein, partial [Klebsiella pneumoniae]|uniref:hypothetical protein n=1 Tax=Klebsiella pneumoniae TaxID=573 RepID=UPI003EB6A057
LLFILRTKILMLERGFISEFSNVIKESEGMVEREIGRKHVLEALKLTRFCLPQPATPSNPTLISLVRGIRETMRPLKMKDF